MSDTILYQVDQLTLTETCLIHREATLPYSRVTGTHIRQQRPLVWLGAAGLLGLAAACTARLWGAGVMGTRMSLKVGLLMAIPSAAIAVYGFTYRITCLQLSIDGRKVTVLKRKDRYPAEVAQRVIETAKRAYGTAGAAGMSSGASDLRSDLNPL